MTSGAGPAQTKACRVWAACAVVMMGLACSVTPTPVSAGTPLVSPDWDRAKTARQAAQRIAVMHRARGPAAAYKLIDACYRTHSLASEYTEGLEICIVQDYLQSQMMTQMFERMTPDARARRGVTSTNQVTEAMQRRIDRALADYQLPPSVGTDVIKIAEKHGTPVYLAVVFSEAYEALRKKNSDKKN